MDKKGGGEIWNFSGIVSIIALFKKKGERKIKYMI